MTDNSSLAQFLDHANHSPLSQEAEIKNLCQEVLEYGFNAAFVNPCWVSFAKSILGDKGRVGTVVSFPLGQDDLETKINASLEAIKNGADELDISSNIGLLKSGREEEYLGEMMALARAIKEKNNLVVVKFIIEAVFLSPEEIKKASELVLQSGADFIKTTSGYGPNDAKLEFVEIIKSVVADQIKIKAAGGIDRAEEVRQYLEAGASRIGTSKAVAIVKGLAVENDQGE